MQKFLPSLVLIFFFGFQAFGQGAYVPFNRDYYHLYDRYEILRMNHNQVIHTGFKPWRRDQLGQLLDSMDNASMGGMTAVDAFNLAYLRNDNWEFVTSETPESKKLLFGKLYQKPSDFYHYRDETIDVHVNPVIYLSAGIEPGIDEFRGRNSRGLELRGSIDRKVAFYTLLTTNQVIFPSWIKTYTEESGAVPGEGFWKRYNNVGYGYFSAAGHISFNISKHIQAQIGHDRNFVGEGYRSMVLSDFANTYPFVKLNTKIWKLQFTNLWAQQIGDINYDNQRRPTDKRYPNKWFAMHRLGMDIGKNLNIGVYESVMMQQFDLNYLNPVIFYRWVEHQLGSPDKLMLGTDFKWNFNKGMQLYGQFVLDEFIFKEFFGISGKNSIRNKHGIQAGYKYINSFGIDNLDLQLEYNQARPYTYQEKRAYQSYSHYRTPLVHPLGANFREAIAIVRYQPAPRLFVNATAMYQMYGDDPNPETNYGKDVLKNRTRPNTGIGLYGNTIGQGIKNDILMGTVNLSYMLKHNLFVDFSHSYRQRTVADAIANESTNYSQVSLRLNMVRHDYNY